ncbi:MAG: hypothetical protein RR626_02960 [Anaerovoracaceae bacterium]
MKAKRKEKIRIKPKEINFYLKYSYDPEAVARKQQRIKMILPLAALLLVVLLIFGTFTLLAISKNKKAEKNEQFILEPTNISQYQEAVAKEEELTAKKEELSALTKKQEEMGKKPTLENSKILLAITDAAGASKIENCSYSVETGKIKIEVDAAKASAVAQIVKKIEASGAFKAVKYQGYQGNDGSYKATIEGIYIMEGER